MLGNLGHYSDILEGRKAHAFSGAGAAILTLAMVAYCDESDFIYKEQDALCFGNWVEHLYNSAGHGWGCMGDYDPIPSGTALMLFRHEFIPSIVRSYIDMGPENSNQRMVEHKYSEILSNRYSMGYDKRRPVNFNDETFWIQQPNKSDIEELKKRKLL